MGAPSKRVWELVHSLTSSESQKFYDRAFEQKRGRYANYVILYDAIREQKFFDEQKLRKKLKDQPFVGHLHRIKNYLYDRILEFVPDARVDLESELYSRLGKIKFLFEKRLYHHLPDQIKKAEKLAENSEDFKGHLKILNYKREMFQVEKNWNDYKISIVEIRDLEKSLLSKENERVELVQLRDQVMGTFGTIGKVEIIPLIKDILREKSKPLSNSAEILTSRIKYNLFLREGEYDKAIEELYQVIEIFRSNPSMIQDYSNFKTFVSAAYYAANFRIHFNDFSGSEEVIELIESFANASKREPVLYYETKISHSLAMAQKTLDERRLRDTITEFKNLPSEIANNLNPSSQIDIFHLVIISLIAEADHRTALKYINQITSIGSATTKQDIKLYSRVLYLVAHYDLGNYDVVERGVKSARITFKRRDAFNPFYESVFRLFFQLVRATTNAQTNATFTRFLEGFDGPSKYTFSAMNNYFDIQSWVRAKCEGRSFKDVLREEFNLDSDIPS